MREALRRLVSDGLVESEAHRGFNIPPVTLDDLRDITAHRRLLECNALTAAIENGDDDWEAKVLAAYHRMTRVEERGFSKGSQQWDEWEIRHPRVSRSPYFRSQIEFGRAGC